MRNHGELEDKLYQFRNYLLEGECPDATIERYGRDMRTFLPWLPNNGRISKEVVIGYKQTTIGGYKTTSTNSMLVSVSRFLNFIQKKNCQVKLFRIQRNPFRKEDRELTKKEYNGLALAAKTEPSGRLFLVIQAICSISIRVDEHRFITGETLERGNVTICNKGRERAVFLPKKLKRNLVQCYRQSRVHSGPAFVTRNGTPVSRCNVWMEIKTLHKTARVSPEKVFLHNLCHLFTVTYYRTQKGIAHLAGMLEHSNIECTGIYMFTSEEGHVHVLSGMCLLT